MEHIIQGLPPNNGRHYVEHEKVSNTFRIREDPDHKDKGRLYEPLLNSEKKIPRSKNKAN